MQFSVTKTSVWQVILKVALLCSFHLKYIATEKQMRWSGITFDQSSLKGGHWSVLMKAFHLTGCMRQHSLQMWEVKTHMTILNMTGVVPTFVPAAVWAGKVCAILLSGVNSDKNYLPWHAIELVSATAARWHFLFHLWTRWGPTTLHNKVRLDKFPNQQNGSQFHQIPHS